MQNICVFVVLITLLMIQIISSFEIINDDQNENRVDDIRQISSSSLSSAFLSFGKQANPPECLQKNLLSNMLYRNQRASISRPYFHHWRPARDNARYSSKNFLAFSPRLGKRAYEDDNESDMIGNKRHDEEEVVEENEINNERQSKLIKPAYRSSDLDTFLVTLVGHLQEKKIDIVFEDSTKICSSQAISDTFIQKILDQFDTNRRQQDEQEAQERHSKGKHPILFRYRLG